MVTLAEYQSRMAEDQKFIYFAAGETGWKRSPSCPQTEAHPGTRAMRSSTSLASPTSSS